MSLQGHVQNGVVVPDEPLQLPEGTVVRIEALPTPPVGKKPARIGGVWNGKVRMAEDFDVLPDDIAEAFGVRTP